MTDTPFNVPPFAHACLHHANAIWHASFSHPFVRGLATGTLSKEKFKFYQMQDARYLEAFADAASLIAVRCPMPKDKAWFLEAARLALEVEGQLHAGYGIKLGYTAEDIAMLELTPSNRAYQDHMVSIAVRGSLLEATAALTPCPWLYIELGRYLLQNLGRIHDDHPYADWLRMYSDPAFNEFIGNLLERLERFSNGASADCQQRAIEAFLTSTRYEWLFWQQAWEGQTWPDGD